jgi:very-short-patch-repair endonuclease
MRKCEICNQEFLTFQQKANHVRWNHKEEKYSQEGFERLREKARLNNQKRFGEKSEISETRTCKCGSTFEVTYSPERSYKGRLTCSLSCWKTRQFSEESNLKKSATLKETLRNNPELLGRAVQRITSNKRSSSRPERELAAALKEYGFKRHQVIRAQDIIFDVDIVSLDKKVWIESDGIWHFEKVHEGHNFDATKLRDSIEEQEAIRRGILLIRLNNQNTSIEQQKEFVMKCIDEWDRITGQIKKLGYNT